MQRWYLCGQASIKGVRRWIGNLGVPLEALCVQPLHVLDGQALRAVNQSDGLMPFCEIQSGTRIPLTQTNIHKPYPIYTYLAPTNTNTLSYQRRQGGKRSPGRL